MVVLTTHFVIAEPSDHHTKMKEIKKHPLYILLSELNNKVLGSELTESELNKLIYILPNLITSTDECSLFITSQIIRNKVSFYFSLRPSTTNHPNIDSNRRDNYTTSLVGDAHVRGLRISLNNTFSAGGRCAPIFACVFGLKPNEMPGDEIVICRCKGLVAAADSNGSMKEGFILFIRGKFETAEEREASAVSTSRAVQEDISNDNISDDESSNQLPTPIIVQSKESRVAQLYRELVYYPFIQEIRENDYGMHPDTEDIPSNLTAVSWMDGCHGQLKLTTTENVLDAEKKKR